LNAFKDRAAIAQEISKRSGLSDLRGTNTTETKPDNATNCFSIYGGLNINTCLKIGVGSIGTFLTYIFGAVLWLAGQAFDLSISISVHQFNEFLKASGTVDTAWSLLRNLVNVSFIFVILYIAVRVVIGKEGNATHLLVNIIVVALLVNFSAFFTRVVIDASNVLANEFYQQIHPEGTTTTGQVAGIAGIFISSKGMNLLENFNPPDKTTSSLSGALATEDNGEAISWGALIVGTFGNIIMVLVTSFVFFAAAIMFLARTITLIILIILSPLAFAAWVIPGLEGQGKKWMSTLLNQAFFAPFCLLFIWLTIQMIQADTLRVFTRGIGGGFWSASTGAVIHYMILIGLMLGALIVSKFLGATSAGAAMKFGGAVTGRMTGGIVRGGRYGFKRADKALGGRLYGKSPLLKYGGAGLKWAEKNIPGVKPIAGVVREPLKATNELVAGRVGAGFIGNTKKEAADQRKAEKEAKEAEKEQKSKAIKEELEELSKMKPEDSVELKDGTKGSVNARVAEIMSDLKPKDIAEFDDALLKFSSVIGNLEEADIRAMSKSGVKSSTMEIITNKIIEEGDAHPAFKFLQNNPGFAMKARRYSPKKPTTPVSATSRNQPTTEPENGPATNINPGGGEYNLVPEPARPTPPRPEPISSDMANQADAQTRNS
jgi:hypothetical protein